jgi:hypothetical protein
VGAPGHRPKVPGPALRRPLRGSADGVALYWLPLGAGDTARCVGWSGRCFETIVAGWGHRTRRELYHSALEVRLGGDCFVIEMAPVWRNTEPDRGVVCEGPVGSQLLGHSKLFRYEVRRWRNGTIPDLAWAVSSPQDMSADSASARRLLELVPHVPTATWGRDEFDLGDMWNSNSLTSWLLARSGHDMSSIHPPAGGRAPGWAAGLKAAEERSTWPPRLPRSL